MDNKLIRFSFKSSIFISISAVVATLVIPYLFSFTGISTNLLTVISNGVVLGFALAYSRYFIDSKQGFGKKFIRTYIIFAISFAVITYFWLYLGNYI